MHFPPIIQRMGKDKQGIRMDRHRVPARLFVDSENVDSRFKKREAPVQLQTSFFYMELTVPKAGKIFCNDFSLISSLKHPTPK